MKRLIQRIRRSLFMELSFSILLMVFPVFLLSLGLLFYQTRQSVKKEALSHATEVLNTAEQRVRSYMQTVETATNSIDWLILKNLEPDSLLFYADRIVRLNGHVSGCSVTGRPGLFPQYGRYFSAYSVRKGDSIVTEREEPYEYFEKVWYDAPFKLGEACWVDPYEDVNEGTLSADDLIASYCKPLYDDDGKFVGVISTDMLLRQFADFFTTETSYPNAYLLLLGEDGRYFSHPDSSLVVHKTIFDIADPQLHPDIIALGHEMTSGKQGSMLVKINGKNQLVCYRPVTGAKWSMALVCPESDILHGYYQMAHIVLLLIVVGLLLILLFCRNIIRKAIRPLGQLEMLSKRIAAGQYNVKISHSDRKDYVGLLQNSFATMQESLDQHVNQIQSINNKIAQSNEELQQAYRAVEEANKRKTLFMQNMSHQIRTPLNIVLGFAKVLLESHQLLSEAEVTNIIGIMRYNAMILNRMALMLYDSSNIQRGKQDYSQDFGPVSVNEVARETLDDVHLHFPSNAPVTFETEVDDSFTIHTNRLYLLRCFREILYNSSKYSDGLHVSLKISVVGGIVRFVLQDTGPGIKEDYYPFLYEPFSKVNDLSEGLGLGLPLTKNHALSLGGDLILDTDYHEGCRFILELPIDFRPDEQPEK